MGIQFFFKYSFRFLSYCNCLWLLRFLLRFFSYSNFLYFYLILAIHKTEMESGAVALECSSAKKNYLRLVKLLVEVGTDLLREKLKSIFPQAKLPEVLNANKNILISKQHLHETNDKLFHLEGNNVCYNDFDIILIYIFLEEI